MKKRLLLFIVLLIVTITSYAQTPILWGLTSGYGAHAGGTLVSYESATGTVINIHNFGADSDGAEPFGSLIQARNGLLYGLTSLGGNDTTGGGYGTIFSFNILTGAENVLYSFNNNADGAHPNTSFIEVGDSLLFATTAAGGTHGFGTIFKFNFKTGRYTKLHDFDTLTDGINPWGTLILVNDSLLFGTTTGGGSFGNGVIFSYDINTDSETVAYNFDGGNADGTAPSGSLLQVGDSLLYGLTETGGNNDQGTIFNFNIYTGAENVLHSFIRITDGRVPGGSLIQVGDSLLYGLTETGGPNDTLGGYAGGALFSYNIFTDTEKALHFFGFGSDGFDPQGSLVQGSDDLLYGMTENGGVNDTEVIGDGTIFSYSISSGTETVGCVFNGADGAFPFGNLIEVDTAAGVEQLTVNNNQLSIYPNPSSDLIYVSLTQQQNQPVQLSLYNMLGQEVYSAQTNLNPIATISVAGLPDGVYVLKVSEGNSIQQKEIVVVTK